MQINTDISSALQQIEAVKKAVDDSDDLKLQANTAESLKTILDILQDPVFRSIIQFQDSVSELNGQISQHPSILPSDFDLSLSGDLILNVPPAMELYDAEYPDEQRVPSAQLSPRSPTQITFGTHDDLDVLEDQQQQQQLNMLKKTRAFTDLNRVNDDERPQSVGASEVSGYTTDIMSTGWVQVQSLELVNDGTGLGFGIIGARNNSGVIVKTIKPGGVADRDERLHSGDHILQIGDVNLHEMGSEQVANVLRQSGTHVRLVVARPVDPLKSNQEMENTALVPARALADPSYLATYLSNFGRGDIFGTSSTPSTPTPASDEHFIFTDDSKSVANRPPILVPTELELPETERFIVELTRDNKGLGITIAGYVCEKEELSGIFVKSVSPGSAADLSGRIHVNDRIIEVNKQSLQGFNNHDAVEVLRNSGSVVSLCLERYLRGPKYEQLQMAIAANELKPTTPSGSGTIFTGPSRPHSGLSMGSHQGLSSLDVLGNRSSISSAAYVNTGSTSVLDSVYDTPAPPKILEKPAVPPKESAALINARKLINARDSVESKMEKDALGGQDKDNDSFESNDSESMGKPKYWVEPVLTKDAENTIINKWRSIVGPRSKIIVAQIRKFSASSGLGISLEGTVDVEGGREVRPHHYIRSILPEGPVGQNNLLCSGDELLGNCKFLFSSYFSSNVLTLCGFPFQISRGQWTTASGNEPSRGGLHPEGAASRCSHGLCSKRRWNGTVHRGECTQEFSNGAEWHRTFERSDSCLRSLGES